jgi:ABC-type Fe3+ transport system permease subunit
MEKDNSKSTILIITVGFLILHLAFSLYWAGIVALIVGITGIVSSYLSAKINWAWMKLSQFLSYIIPNIVLSIVFFLFLYPISLLSKLFNKDQLMLSKKYDSYFIDVNKEMDKKSFEKMW